MNEVFNFNLFLEVLTNCNRVPESVYLRSETKIFRHL